MGDAEERKRAKEAYMKALEAQRQKPTESANATFETQRGGGQTGPLTAAQKREQQLEERRKKFFDKSNVDGANVKPADRHDDYFATAAQPATQQSHVREAKETIPAMDPVIRPSDWKSKGYPSEYAYMKAAGQLSISNKPPVSLESNTTNPFAPGPHEQSPPFQQAQQVSLSQFEQGQNSNNDGQVDKRSHALDPQFGNHFLTYNSNIPMNGVAGLNIGSVVDKEQKKQKQMDYARALNQQESQSHPSESRTISNSSQNPSNRDYGGGGGGLNFGGGVDDKEAKRQKQAEYARALDQQSHSQAPAESHHRHRGQVGDPFANSPGSELAGGGGLNFGAVDDKELKRQKQHEYARALDQQTHAMSHAANGNQFTSNNSNTSTIGGGSGGLNIGGIADDKEAKRQKQAEYARALDQQSFAQPSVDAHAHHSKALTHHHAHVSANRDGGGGGLNIGSIDDKEAKRQKQAEYAHALDQQSHAGPVASRQANHVIDPTNNMGGLNIGAVDDKDVKRQKQAEYARALNQQQQNSAWGAPGGGRSGVAGGGGYGEGLGLAGLGGPEPQEAAHLKRLQQQEYNNQLNQAQYQQPSKLNKFGEYEHNVARGSQQARFDGGGLSGLGGPQGKEALDVKRQQQQEYTNQLNAQTQYQQPTKLNRFGEYEQPGRLQAQQQQQQQMPSGARNADISNIGADDGKLDKRAKQAEYNMALQQQQYLQSLQQPLKGNKHTEHRAIGSTAVTGFKADGGLEEGWVIGPMGLPVRKTLEVGNRGVQRAYANHIAETHSPSKVHMGRNLDNALGRGFEVDSFQQAAHMLNSPPKYGMPMGGRQMFGDIASFGNGQHGSLAGDIGGNPDDRAMKVKLQQAEQARVLEMQIRANQERKNAEKKRIEEEDEKEMQRMEMQRIAIQKELEREALEKKMKIDEENRKELERQMIAKKAEKEMEMAREQARLVEEEERVRAEAEIIRKRQELEMQREAAAAQWQQNQRQQALELEQKQNQLQAEALHRKNESIARQNPGNYLEPAPARDWAAKPGSRGGSGGNSHLFDKPDPYDNSTHNDPPRSGARNRNHLFDRADDDTFGPAAVRTDYEQQNPPDRYSSTPMSPNKRNVDRVLAERVNNERLNCRTISTDQHDGRQMPHRQHQEAVLEAKAVAPPILNLNNLKRNISEGAVVSGRRSARGASRSSHRTGTAPKASPHDPYHPERERQEEEAEAVDSFSPLPMHRPPSRSVVQSVNRKSAHRLEENQYVPASQLHAHQASGGRLDKTLEFESKFLLPDGTFMHSNSKPSTPARMTRWSRLGAQEVGHSSDNRCNSRGSSSAMAEMLSPGKSPQDSPQRGISSPASGPTKSLIDEFKDTLHLLQEPRAALAQSMSQQRPSTSGSTNSDFDLEKFNRRNARKWQALQNINGDKDSPEEDLLFRAVGDVHSRPSTSGSTGSYRPKLFDPFPAEMGGYSYGGRVQPASAFHPVRGGGIAVGSSDDLSSFKKDARPSSAELAQKLSRLNNHEPHQAFEPPKGYVSRPRSGKRDNNKLIGDSFTMGQRAEMSLQAPAGLNSYGSRNRYANVAASVEDQDFDNYSDYGL